MESPTNYVKKGDKMSLFPQSGFKHSKEETEAWNRYWEVTNMNIKIEVDNIKYPIEYKIFFPGNILVRLSLKEFLYLLSEMEYFANQVEQKEG